MTWRAAWLLSALCGLATLVLAEAILARFTYQEHWKTLFLVALALSLPPSPERNLILTSTYLVVLFSIVVQGLTIKRVLRRYL